jgi:hypothetical protein
VSEHARAEPQAEPAPPSAAERPPAASLPGLVTQLQRTAGNRAVVQLLARAPAAPPAEALDQKDMDALQAYGKVFQLQQSGADAATTAPAKREAIVKLALSQVGKVRDEDRGDGKKKGAERLKEFYRVACPSYNPSYDKGIETPGMWAGQQKKGDSREGLPWSWCAIFGVWAIRQITGIGSFAGQPIGLGPVHRFLKLKPEERAAAVKPGDLICRREEYEIKGQPKPEPFKPLNHQCLVASVDDSGAEPKVTTINGNGYYQEIHVRTEPLSYYWGYYDSLSQTDVEAYEKRIRKDYGWAVKLREKAGLPGV